MFWTEAAWAGDTAVICVADSTVKLVAAAVPKVTSVAPVNAVPVAVTVVPPAVGPDVGEIAVTAGTGVANDEAAAVAGSKPPLTVASTTPANRDLITMTRHSRFPGKVTRPNARVSTDETIA